MPELPDVIAGEAVESAWGNDIRDRTVQRYADSTERDSLVPLPIAGDVAWLDTEMQLTIFDGAAWSVVADAADYLPLSGGVMTGVVDLATGSRVVGATQTRLDIVRSDGPFYWRLAIASAGSVLLQSSTDGSNFTTVQSWDIGMPVLPWVKVGTKHQVFQNAPLGSWGTIVSEAFTPPVSWRSYDILLTGGIGQAGMTAGNQIHARCRWSGAVGPATASGNSDGAGARDITTSMQATRADQSAITMDLQGSVVGVTAAGITKYGWLSWVATRLT